MEAVTELKVNGTDVMGRYILTVLSIFGFGTWILYHQSFFKSFSLTDLSY